MQFHTQAATCSQVSADWLIVGLFEDDSDETPLLADLDQSLDGALARLREAGDLTGKLAETVALRNVPGLAAKRLLVVGLGKRESLTMGALDKAWTAAARQVSTKENISVAVALPSVEGTSLSGADAARAAAIAMQVGSAGQDLYRKERKRFPFSAVTVVAADDAQAAELSNPLEQGCIIGQAVNLTRELVNRPPAEIYPESFAERAQQLAEEHGMQCEVMDEKRLREERMNALLAVAQGSSRPPRGVIVRYQGAGPNDPVLALVGKGVTFDSGGLSLKSSENMLTMKCDMAGAATVLGTVTAVARLGLPVNVVGYMGLVENMPSGSSYKLGDILTARNGTTIEVLNTDAEGRLVLADMLSYAVEQQPARIVDLATLTGACVVALGEDVVGAFTNDQAWCDQVLQAARRAGEDVWQLPMFELYEELIKGDVGDIKNTGGRWGGAITAAKFLENFVGDVPWVHLDIAGPAFASSDKPHREGGATGCMVRTLVELVSGGQ